MKESKKLIKELGRRNMNWFRWISLTLHFFLLVSTFPISESHTPFKDVTQRSNLSSWNILWENWERQSTGWKSHWIQSWCEGEYVQFPPEESGNFYLWYLICACFISLLQCFPFIFTLFLFFLFCLWLIF